MAKKEEAKKHEKHQSKNESTKIEKLNQELQQKDNKIQELTQSLQRLQAEFDNYRKREANQQESAKEKGEQNIIKELLGVLDNFDLAFQNNKDPKDFEKGIELIYSQIYDLLENKGLKRIPAEGKDFNPQLHEALMTEKKQDIKPNKVLQELQKGYEYKGNVLRHTKVKVSK